MDSLSALSVAAAVVQFSEFGFKLLKEANDIRKSAQGQTEETIQLSAATNELTRLVKEAEEMLPRQLKEGQGLMARDVFQRVCVDCKVVNDDLQKILRKLQARSGGQLIWTLSSFATAVRSVMKAGEVEVLKGRLDEIRMQAMLSMMCIQLGEAAAQKQNLNDFLASQRELKKELESNSQAARGFGAQSHRYTAKDSAQVDDMVRYITSVNVDQETWRDLYNLPEGSQSPVVASPMDLQMVIKDLFFQAMRDRESEIPKQFPDTCEWIFEELHALSNSDEQNDQNLAYWHSFPQWLSSTDSREIYWIKGVRLGSKLQGPDRKSVV